MPTSDHDFFNGICFTTGRNGPDMYEKTLNKMALYSSTYFKNGSDVDIWFRSEEYVGPEQPVLPNDPTPNDESIWEY